MAVYGISFYGSDLYGQPAEGGLTVAPMSAESIEYGQIRVKWSSPGAGWSKFRLLRNGFGEAVDEWDGEILLEFDEEDFVSNFRDRDLQENRFYYYSVFLYEDASSSWVFAGSTLGLVLKHYRHYERLVENLPAFYMAQDDAIRSFGVDEGPFSRLLRIFGKTFDHVHGEAESLLRVRDPDLVSGNLLPALAADLGVLFEPEIGTRQMRILLRNIVYLSKIKGTQLGVEGIASAMTGWGANSSVTGDEITIDFQGNRVNLVPNPSFEVDTVGWQGVGATIARSTTAPLVYGVATVEVTATQAGDVSLESV